MSDTDDTQHRAYHQPDPENVELRDLADDEDGVFTVRMPIASTGDVRNEGDEALTRDELSGMASQIEERAVGVFLDHGASALGGGGGMFGNRYSAIGKVGEWTNPDMVERNDADAPALLEADARLMDPETLPAATGDVREALAALKSQVERGFALASSIGWREDESYPGGNDLMEASIVGIGADPRTVSESTAAVARAAIDAGADPEAFMDEIRAVVMEPDSDAHMSETEETDESAEQSADDTERDDQDEQRDAPEWAQQLLEEQRKQTELLTGIDEAVRQDDEDDEEDDDEDDEDGEENEGDHDDEEDEDEQSAENAAAADEDADESDETQDVDDEVAELREAYTRLEEGGVDVSDVDLPHPDDDQSADDESAESTADEDAAKALLKE